jgi:hypothetical protein
LRHDALIRRAAPAKGRARLEQGWQGRRIPQETASGILVAALGMLQGHYRLEP